MLLDAVTKCLIWIRLVMVEKSNQGNQGYSISLTMIIDLFTVFQFSFLRSSTPDVTLNEQLDGCFYKSRGRLPYRCTWFSLAPFAHLLSCVRVVSVISCSLLCVSFFLYSLYPWNILFWLSIEFLFPWLPLNRLSFCKGNAVRKTVAVVLKT